MNLYLLQHGEAVLKEIDPERPLSEQGSRDIRILALHMANMRVQLEHILHSGKLRARQSAELIAEKLSPELELVQAEGLNPTDDPAAIIGDLEQISGNLLIASHMPFVSRLCSVLLTGTTDAEFASLPGTLFCLEQSEGKWRLAYMLRPDFL
ncbi:MAG: phosphohistidine phosphatase SixA [Gammaproteobacteria bacterium]|nr:phosphohistidine phosphatase SixA [Gammaproteobacteria bacterium]